MIEWQSNNNPFDDMTMDLIEIKNKYEKIHVIQNADSNAGFSALITYALNGVRKAIENNWIPVVDYNAQNLAYFYDEERGENIWAYYFYPIAKLSIDQVEDWLDQDEIAKDFIHEYSKENILNWHHIDPARIATFWSKEKPPSPEKWINEKRALGRKYVAKYIKVKPHILQKVSDFQAKYLENTYSIGVHIRGTDFSYAKPTSPETYIEAIHHHLDENKIKEFNLFLATDQVQFIEVFEKEFPGRVSYYNAIRSENHVAPFHFKDVNNYKKGEDVLIDMLLLSNCQFLFKGAAAVGEYALWLNPILSCYDFALESDIERGRYSLRKGAFFKIDLGDKGSMKLKITYIQQVFRQILEQVKLIFEKDHD